MAFMIRMIWLVIMYMAPFPLISAQTACSPDGRESDLEACLEGIRLLTEDNSLFWFGTVERAKCQGPELAQTIDCYSPHPGTPTLSELIFSVRGTDLSSLDRFLDVRFTSEPGTYTGCDYQFSSNETKQFSLDPLSMDAYESWDLRNMPDITWTPDSPSDLYTMVYYDPGYGFVNGLFLNIIGGDMSDIHIKVAYFGPRNPREIPNPYVFVLYKQTERIDIDSVPQPLRGFNITSFAETNQLQGPVALNIMLTNYDAYGITFQRQLGRINNCASLIYDAFRQHRDRPFIPFSETSYWTVQLRLQIVASEITYMCGQESITESATSFYVDPIGNPIVSTASARTGSTLNFEMNMNKMFPNDRVDFDGKVYSILMVDPDIPAGRSVGNNEYPLLHGLITNIQGANVTSGDVIQEYLGPRPPDYSRHVYYFLLYEQTGDINVTDTSGYSTECGQRLAGRCMFDVLAFTASYNMTLVGATWFSATTDNYIHRCEMDADATLAPTDAAGQLMIPHFYLVLFTLITVSMVIIIS